MLIPVQKINLTSCFELQTWKFYVHNYHDQTHKKVNSDQDFWLFEYNNHNTILFLSLFQIIFKLCTIHTDD